MLFPDQAALVGPTEFVDYVVPTTEKLADAVTAKAPWCDSLILVNHGLVNFGKNLREAYYRTEVTEESAKIYLAALAVKEPKRLTAEEVDEIRGLSSEAYRIQLLQNQ